MEHLCVLQLETALATLVTTWFTLTDRRWRSRYRSSDQCILNAFRSPERYNGWFREQLGQRFTFLTIRIKRICSTIETTKQKLGDLHHHLKRWGYNDKVIDSGFSKASEIDRNHFMSTSSINRNHERGCLIDERSNRSSRSPINMLA
jgi:hypothetical protein